MITARLALDQNREVFALPHRTADLRGDGCNRLIQMSVAKLVRNSNDVLMELGSGFALREETDPQQSLEFSERNPKWRSAELSPLSVMICELLEKGQLHTDDLCNKIEQPVHIVLNELLQLEFAGFVQTLPGKMVRLQG